MPKNRTARAKALSALTIKLIGNAVFDKAQELVPEGDTGGLRKSGSISFDSKGFYIKYSAPYAKQVHDGDDDGFQLVTNFFILFLYSFFSIE